MTEKIKTSGKQLIQIHRGDIEDHKRVTMRFNTGRMGVSGVWSQCFIQYVVKSLKGISFGEKWFFGFVKLSDRKEMQEELSND